MPIYSLPSATKYMLLYSLKVQKDSCETSSSSKPLLFNGGKNQEVISAPCSSSVVNVITKHSLYIEIDFKTYLKIPN